MTDQDSKSVAEVEKEVLITLSKKALKCYRYATLP